MALKIMAQNKSLWGEKVVQGGPKYLQGGSCPPALPLPAPMTILMIAWSWFNFHPRRVRWKRRFMMIFSASWLRTSIIAKRSQRINRKTR